MRRNRGRRAAGTCRPARGRARPHALPLRPALDARPATRRRERAREARGDAADPGPEPLARALGAPGGRWRRLRRAPAPRGRRNRLRALHPTRPPGRAARRGRPRAGRRRPRGLRGRRRPLAGGARRRRALSRCGRRAARDRGDARHRRRRPPLHGLGARRLVDPVPDLAQRPGPRLPLPRRPARRHARRRDRVPVAGGELDRVRVPHRTRGADPHPLHGPPRRGARRRAPTPRATGRASCASTRASPSAIAGAPPGLEAALDRRDARVLPRLVRSRLGARR